MSPFDFLNAINETKQNLFEDPLAEKDYNAFLINRGLSYFPDTLFHSNMMNKYPDLDKKMQFDFYVNSISKRKRFSKWHKKEVTPDTLKLIQDYYKYSEERALEALSLLTDEKIKIIENKMYKGGRNDH